MKLKNVHKIPTSIATSGKNRKRGSVHGDNMAVYGKFDVVIPQKIKTRRIYNEKNSGDSSHQVLTNFSFSELLTSDFRQNKFLKFLIENNVVKFREFIVTKMYEVKNSEKLKLVEA
jgi:hypothetical protein